MIKDKKIRLNRIISILVIITLIFSPMAMVSAKIEKDENTKSKIVGVTEDGKDFIVQVDKIHPVRPQSPGKSSANSCFKLLGVKWKSTPVSYVINPNNPFGLSETFITTALSTSAETWDDATSKELFDNTYSINNAAVWGNRDYSNNLIFGDYPSNSAIAVTRYWYTMRGRQLLEFDIIFNTRFIFGDGVTNPLIYDLQGIATHEIGHGAGMDDIYSSACGYVTMYGYSWPGDVDKRTLEGPDIEGIQKMYG